MSLLFESRDEHERYIFERIERLHPSFERAGSHFQSFLRDAVDDSSVVVDAGCGNAGIVGRLGLTPARLIGVDADADLLEQNPIVDEKVVADLECLPLADDSVDVVTSQFVFEHLRDPPAAFAEFARVLKPGGALVFLTPNVLNPVMLVSKLTPYRFHRLLRYGVLNKDEETFPTYYRANSARRVRALANAAGLRERSLRRTGNAGYIGFCKPLVLPAVLFERAIDNRPLGFLKTYLEGHYVKPTPARAA